MIKLTLLCTVILYNAWSAHGDLTSTINSNIVTYKTVTKVGEITNYSKTTVNESSPIVATFTWTTPSTLNDTVPMVWTFNGKTVPLTTVNTNDAYYTISDGDGKRIITLRVIKNIIDYVGVVTLTLNPIVSSGPVTASVTFLSPPMISGDDKARRHLEGDKNIRIKCPVKGYPAPATVSWSRVPQNTNDTKDIVLSTRVNTTTSDGSATANDILVFDPLEYVDDGYINCTVVSDQGTDTLVVELRVKDRLAALWPFIGIVIEVLVLVTVILLYEKRRSRHFMAGREDTKEGANGGYGQVAMSPAPEGGDTDAETRQRAVKA